MVSARGERGAGHSIFFQRNFFFFIFGTNAEGGLADPKISGEKNEVCKPGAGKKSFFGSRRSGLAEVFFRGGPRVDGKQGPRAAPPQGFVSDIPWESGATVFFFLHGVISNGFSRRSFGPKGTRGGWRGAAAFSADLVAFEKAPHQPVRGGLHPFIGGSSVYFYLFFV